MRTDIKQAWIAELKSGNYTQGRGRLKDCTGAYCCLGVFVEVIQRDFPELAAPHAIDYEREGYDNLHIDGLAASLPEKLWKAAQANEDQAVYWHMNDTDQKTFSEIAAEIAARE